MKQTKPQPNPLGGPVPGFRAVAIIRGPWKHLLRDFELLQPRAAARSFEGKDFDLDLKKTSHTEGRLQLSLSTAQFNQNPDAVIRKLLARLNKFAPRRRRWRLAYQAELSCEVSPKAAGHRVTITPELLALLRQNVLGLAFEVRSPNR